MKEPNNPPRSEKHELARRSLPEDLRPIFDEFVEDYKLAGLKHYDTPFISYLIAAEMVLFGWRHVDRPMKQEKPDTND